MRGHRKQRFEFFSVRKPMVFGEGEKTRERRTAGEGMGMSGGAEVVARS